MPAPKSLHRVSSLAAGAVSFQPLERRTLLSGAVAAAVTPARPLHFADQLHLNSQYAGGGVVYAHPTSPSMKSVNYLYFDLPAAARVDLVAFGTKDYSYEVPDPVIELIRDKNANSIVDKGEVQVIANNEIHLARNLDAGRWFVRASLPAGADYSSYEVSLFTAQPTPEPVNFRRSVFWADSQNVNAATTTPVIADYYNTVGAAASHYYAVKFTHRAGLRATLDQMYGNVDLQLIKDLNGNGRVDKADILISSNRTRAKADYVNAALDPGTYVLRVLSTGGVSPYHLHLSAVTSPATDPGSSMATAFDLGPFDPGPNHPQTYMNSIGGGGNRRDYYKVTTTGTGRVARHPR